MKFQSILVFLVASLAAGTYAVAPAQTPCEIGKFNVKFNKSLFMIKAFFVLIKIFSRC